MTPLFALEEYRNMSRTPLLIKSARHLFSGEMPSFYSLFLSITLVLLFAYIFPGTNVFSGLLVLTLFIPMTYLIGYDLVSAATSSITCCIGAIISAERRAINSQLSVNQNGEWLYCEGFVTVSGISNIVASYILTFAPLSAAVIISHIISKSKEEHRK